MPDGSTGTLHIGSQTDEGVDPMGWMRNYNRLMLSLRA